MQKTIVTAAALEQLYHERLAADFSPDELKPLGDLQALCRAGRYFGYAFYHQERLVGYALLTDTSDRQTVLLDYLAVVPEQRGAGFGSAILRALHDEFAPDRRRGLLVEVEAVDAAPDDAERRLRSRRVAFYQKNGLRHSQVSACWKGLRLDVLVMDLGASLADDSVENALRVPVLSDRQSLSHNL